jgi:hypothetical protein
MIFHASFAARNPRQVTSAIAEIIGGTAMQFPFVGRASWVAVAGDDKGTMIEVYADGEELQPDIGEAVAVRSMPRRFSATHLAIATQLSEAEVLEVADRENWLARYCKRGGEDFGFGVIELWVENRLLVEVLTQDMQREYLAMAKANWNEMTSQPELSHAA